MINLEPQITQNEIIQHFVNLGKPTLNPNEAALFLCSSKRTLERWREAGTGPAFRKNPAGPNSSASNQKVYYLITDLLAYIKSSTFKSNIEVAISRGFAFASLACLSEDQPFFIDKKTGLISAHAYLLDASFLFDYHPSTRHELVWLSWVVALNRGWDSPNSEILKSNYHELLNNEFEKEVAE